MNPEPSYLDLDEELYPTNPPTPHTTSTTTQHQNQLQTIHSPFLSKIPENIGYQGESNQTDTDTLDKQKRRRTVRDMLIMVDQFRKWQITYKGTLQDYSQITGINRRTLEYYMHSVKQGERFGFAFQKNLDCKLSEFQRFLKEKSLLKKAEELAMLAKLKNYYK